jgi:membrane-associated phospholipid phosphatase
VSTEGATLPSDHPGEAAPLANESRALGQLMTATVFGFVLLVVGLMIARGVWLSPDVLAILAGVAALLIGRGRLFLRDWLPFIAIFLAWQTMRGLADDLGLTVHSDIVIAAERAIAFGHLPSVELQRLLYRPGVLSPLDVAMSVLYMAHFGFPVLLAFFLWLRNRRDYYQYVGMLLVMAVAAFVIFVFFPVAPPRFAFQYGEAIPVRDVMRETLDKMNFSPAMSSLYAGLPGNPVAAFPSLHAAFPALGYLFMRKRYPRASWVILLYGFAVLFAIIYLGHHYLVDAMGGVVLAGLSYFAWPHIWGLVRAASGPRQPRGQS